MAGAEAAASAAASTTVADDPPACDDSACSTPFVSAPSSPTRDRDRDPYPSHFFFSAPTSPTRGGGGKDAIPGVLDFDFDFSSRFPSPSAAAMSSADELFHNGQIRPVRLAAALLQPHPDPALLLDFPDAAAEARRADAERVEEEAADERGRVRSRSLRRKARSMSPFRTHWRTASHAPAQPVPETESADEAQHPAAATPAASRSSSSSSTASSASSTSSSSSRGSRRWGGFLKDLLHRSKPDGGKTTHHLQQHSHHADAPAAPTAAAKPSASSPSPSPAKGRGGAPGHRGGRRRSAHERLYEARRAEAEEMRRRTSLPYRQGLLLFGCIGLGNRSYGAVHGLARGLNATAAFSSRS
ncbi:uncharacterized protein [Miscanthus floridulus]|uniref:uncharacterized protein n=1 Tax=Miscanthus floridulus TaxID=154761 RepID=UPI0034598679